MKIVKLLSLVIIAGFFVAGCTEDIMDDINENKNNPVNAASRFILSDVMTSTAFSVAGSDYAFYSSVYMELNAGIFGQMNNAELRISEPISATTYNNIWNAQYRNLRHIKEVETLCADNGKESGNYHNLAIAQIMKAYHLALLTDLMGDVPYVEALMPGFVFQPKIDKQEVIYADVFKLLDEAIANIDKTTSYTNIGTQDFIYAGKLANWKKAANGLKARYTLRLSHKTPQYAKVLEYANASFANASEEFKYVYKGSSVNPFSRFLQDRNYFGASKSLNDKLIARSDPRAAKFFKANPKGDGKLYFADNGNFEAAQNLYGISGVSAASNPTYLMSYHELEFIKAEVYARAATPDLVNAENSLKKAINAAFVKVGLTVDAAETYYTESVKPLFDANPLREIMNQKYLAAYEDEGVEAYNDYRRLKAMGETLVSLANTKEFPLRFTYGVSDVTTNPNVRSAYGDGSYVYKEPVWWAGGTR